MVPLHPEFMKAIYKILRFILVCHMLVFICHFSSAQGYELTFGGPGTQICNGLAMTSDSSVYMLGFTSAGTFGGTDFMLSKISPNGQLLWTKYFGSSHDDFGVSVIATDTGLVLAGMTHDPVLSDQVLLIVTDTSGNELNRYTYGSFGTENINDARSCPDGGFIIAGSQTNSGSNYAYVLKVDSLFNQEWSNIFSGGINDYASEALMADNNTYYVASDRKFNVGGGSFDYDICLLKIDSTGNAIWDSVYHDPFQNGSQGLLLSQSGNVILYGETEVFQFSAFDYFISSSDSNGNLLWRYVFGGSGSNALFDLVEDNSGNLIGTGYGNSASNGNDPINVSLIKMDANGNLIWQREYGFQGIDVGFRILHAPDGGFLVAGRATTANDDDFYLLKVDADGLTSMAEAPLTSAGEIGVYPNPSTDYFYIKSSQKFTQLRLFDAFGRMVFSSYSNGIAGAYFRVEIPDVSKGTYLLELSDSKLVTGRTVLIKN